VQYFQGYGKIFHGMGERAHADDINIERCIFRQCSLIDPAGYLNGDLIPKIGAFEAGKGFLDLPGVRCCRAGGCLRPPVQPSGHPEVFPPPPQSSGRQIPPLQNGWLP